MSHSDHPPAVDPSNLSVSAFVASMPVRRLLSLVAAILAAGATGGFATGYWKRGVENDAEIGRVRSEAESSRRTAETLQQAIAAGNCVKSRELQRADAARSLVARLNFQIARIRDVTDRSQPGYYPDPSLEMDLGAQHLDLFGDDPRLHADFARLWAKTRSADSALRHAMISQRNLAAPPESWSQELISDEQKSLSASRAELDAYVAEASSAREYLKAKYLALEASAP